MLLTLIAHTHFEIYYRASPLTSVYFPGSGNCLILSGAVKPLERVGRTGNPFLQAASSDLNHVWARMHSWMRRPN